MYFLVHIPSSLDPTLLIPISSALAWNRDLALPLPWPHQSQLFIKIIKSWAIPLGASKHTGPYRSQLLGPCE